MLNLKSNYNPLDTMITESGELSGEAYLAYTLDTMVAEGKINEAEDLLFENITAHPHAEYLKVALDFYARLAEMDEAELERHDFSHQEILDGLSEVRAICGKAGIKEE